ncbi:phosphatase PAP2 family protein [Actinokineospora cianjurensis]|uniref:phosphatase PAP2 family protein n=1 Tax=Actinokineospora cianjurensis TaxID=585224 RepID=UPI0011C447E8|nr:phosphatase PAP2 family protein [Actinokineospora cianjurensis]
MEAHRLMPRFMVLPAVGVATACFGVVGLVGREVSGPVPEVDSLGFAAADRVFTAVPGIAEPLSYATHPVALIGVIMLMAIVAHRVSRPRVALLAVFGPAVAVTFNAWVLKPVVGRELDGYLAYPSGHTTALVSILTVFTLVTASNAAQGRRLRATTATAVVCLVLTGAAVSAIVGLRYHYLTDTVGGSCWAIGAVITVAAVLDLLPGRHPALRLRREQAYRA